jgi:hypothetical protein
MEKQEGGPWAALILMSCSGVMLESCASTPRPRDRLRVGGMTGDRRSPFLEIADSRAGCGVERRGLREEGKRLADAV